MSTAPLGSVLLALLIASSASAVTMDWTFIGNPGNAGDTLVLTDETTGHGSVPYTYSIGTYEVTNAQYTEFLNSVDSSGNNTLQLYDEFMEIDTSNGGVSFVPSNASGSKYVVKSGFADKPITWVDFYDALRFANWMNNGQGGGDTETGAYTITETGITENSISRNPGATIFLPNQDEWYKAAFYSPSGAYFLYATGTNAITCSAPTAIASRANCEDAVGSVTNVGAYTGSASPYGTFDQSGNVYEWLDAPVGTTRQTTGGGWGDPAIALSSYISPGEADPTYDDKYVGIRLAGYPTAIPEPGTGLLVITGLLGLARWRKQRQ